MEIIISLKQCTDTRSGCCDGLVKSIIETGYWVNFEELIQYPMKTNSKILKWGVSLILCSLFFYPTAQSQTITAQQSNFVPGWYYSLVDYVDFMDMDPMPMYQSLGQTFTATASGSLSELKFYVSGHQQNGSVDIEFYSSDDLNSFTTLLGTKATVPIDGNGWITTSLSSLNINITAAGFYGFKLKPNYGLNSGIGVNRLLPSHTDSYSGGKMAFSGGGSFGFSDIDDVPFILSVNALLPVNFCDFTVQSRKIQAGLEDHIVVKWATCSESNSNYFIVQESNDGIHWNDIKKVQASNQSNQRINYEIETQAAISERSFYRIKEVDMDLKFFYSPIKTLSRETKQALYTIEGNYVIHKMLKIHSTVGGTFRLMNQEGKLVYSRIISKGDHNLLLETVATGYYLIRFANKTLKIFVE